MTTTQAGPKLALRHYCINYNASGSASHTQGSGKGPAKCAYCKGSTFTIAGLYGVFPWGGHGRYLLTEALSTHTTERAANAKRVALDPNEQTLVVRFLNV
jgi:hypothetical protein